MKLYHACANVRKLCEKYPIMKNAIKFPQSNGFKLHAWLHK